MFTNNLQDNYTTFTYDDKIDLSPTGESEVGSGSYKLGYIIGTLVDRLTR